MEVLKRNRKGKGKGNLREREVSLFLGSSQRLCCYGLHRLCSCKYLESRETRKP